MTGQPAMIEEFAEIDRRVAEVLEQAGNPEGIDASTRQRVLADRLTRYGSRDYSHLSFEPQPEPDLPPEPEPDDWSVAGAQPGEAYWYERPEDARFMRLFIEGKKGPNGRDMEGGLLITGPAGCGKTQGVLRLFRERRELHGEEFLVMDCPTITDPQKWFGRREVTPERGTHYVKSDFINAVEAGHNILLNELPRLHPTLFNPVMSLLDGVGEVALSDLNLTVRVHPHTAFFATANQGAQYGGNHRLDWALRRRFPYTIERGWPPKADEVRIITSRTGCDPDAADALVDIAAKTRDLFAQGKIRGEVSTAVLIDAGRLVRWGMTERQALAYTARVMFDENADGTAGEASDRAQFDLAVDGRLGRRQ